MNRIDRHFSAIAESYREMRSTELAPIRYIAQKVKTERKLIAADVGCGCGRYSFTLIKHFKQRISLVCIDRNVDMLDQLKDYLRKNSIHNFIAVQSDAGSIPMKDQSLNLIVTFNAIHHFPFLQFLKEAWRLLRRNGLLFIFTRTRSQNQKNVWGKYFPLFTTKESRLYEIQELKQYIELIPEFVIEEIRNFHFEKRASLKTLIRLAQKKHYSTFALYSPDEFERSLASFSRNLRKNFPDLSRIKWINENVMFVIRKC